VTVFSSVSVDSPDRFRPSPLVSSYSLAAARLLSTVLVPSSNTLMVFTVTGFVDRFGYCRLLSRCSDRTGKSIAPCLTS